MLRLMRQPGTGRWALEARLVAAAVAVGLLALSAPVVILLVLPALRWLAALI